ncbi:MAG: hypothetical protein JNM93_06635 [Bacteriovoracaceae bacterium]|nr:hypothetical protein [Bacteriovoracaceae bacterium]
MKIFLTPFLFSNFVMAGYVPQNHEIRIGDMLIDEEEITTEKGATALFIGTTWTDGILPIEFANDLTEKQKMDFLNACSEWEKIAKINCKIRKNEDRYVYVQKNAKGCFASIGMGTMPWSKKRTLNLEEGGCWNKRTIVHEIGHSLSLLHEHQRSDRDRYVKIEKDNVQSGAKSNFFKIFWTKEYSDYDFLSIMHYRDNAFAKTSNLMTINARPGYTQYQGSMGRLTELSQGDQETVRKLYGP